MEKVSDSQVLFHSFCKEHSGVYDFEKGRYVRKDDHTADAEVLLLFSLFFTQLL